jgi:hypothetical protein
LSVYRIGWIPSVDGSFLANFLTRVKKSVRNLMTHVSFGYNLDDFNSVPDGFCGTDSDFSLWYTSGYTALANFFLKPKLKLGALDPISIVVKSVKTRTDGEISELGPKEVSFVYLTIKNNGKADAKDCVVTVLAPDPGTLRVFPVELRIIYCAIAHSEMELVLSKVGQFQINIFGRPMGRQTSKTITKNGGQDTLLLGFRVEGGQLFFMGVGTDSVGALPLQEHMLTLRTSTDGKLHRVRLLPQPDRIDCEVLD